jgi:hypothetical protein
VRKGLLDALAYLVQHMVLKCSAAKFAEHEFSPMELSAEKFDLRSISPFMFDLVILCSISSYSIETIEVMTTFAR